MLTATVIKDQIQQLMKSQKLAIVSTQLDGQPYASLVAFVGTKNLKNIYFVTPKTTRKFHNLTNESRVAILINNSTNAESDFHAAISVTITGTANEVAPPEKTVVLERYLDKHPYLEDFANSPTCAIIEVTAKSYYLVQNFQQVSEFQIK